MTPSAVVREAEVTAAGARLRWVDVPGPGVARLFLHGLGAMSAPYFAAAVAHPALGGARSLLADLLGHGLSDRPDDADYELETHADLVAAALRAAAVDRVDVVGHSMGGSVAILLAARHPDLVRSLVLVDPNLDPQPPLPGDPGSRGIAAYRERDFVAATDVELEALVGAAWWSTLRLAGRVAVHRSATSLIRPRATTLRDVVSALSAPRTLLFPADDAPYDGAPSLTAAGVHLVAIPDTGHNVMTDNPDAFARATASALGALSPSGRPPS